MTDQVRVDCYPHVALRNPISILRTERSFSMNLERASLPDSMKDMDSGDLLYLGGDVSALVYKPILLHHDSTDPFEFIFDSDDPATVCKISREHFKARAR